jgi:RNA polymerase sigma-70 factor (ECF subfamily)
MEPQPSAAPGFEELLAHSSFLSALARELCAQDRHGAEDLAQDVWIALLEQRQGSPHRITSWLARVARNLRASRLRRASPELAPEELEGASAREGGSELARAELAESRKAVASAVQRLRDPYREVLILRYYEGLTLREIARRRARPLQTVRTQIKRALPLLREELARERGSNGSARTLALVAISGRRPTPAIAPSVLATATFVAAAGLVTTLVWLFDGDRSSQVDVALAAAAPSAAREADELLSAARAPDAGERTQVTTPTHAPDAEVAQSSAPDPDAELEVLVVDGSGAPVPDAEVLVYESGGWVPRARSDERGRAAIALETADLGSWAAPASFAALSARAEGRARIVEVLVDTSVSRAAPLELPIGEASARLSAQAVDSYGFGIDGAELFVAPGNPALGTSRDGTMGRVARHLARADADGRFELGDLPPGPSKVYLAHPDLGLSECPVELAPGDNGPLELAFAAGATLRGAVSDPEGNPRAGVILRSRWNSVLALPLEWIKVQTEPDGSYAMSLPVGFPVELWATDATDDHLQAYARFDPEPGESIDWSPRLRRWDPVLVRLVDGAGEPLADWLVALRSVQGDALGAASSTNRDGRAVLVLPIEGELRLEVLGPFAAQRGLPLHTVQGIEPDASRVYTFALDRERRGLGGLMGQLAPAGWSPPADVQLVVERAEDASSARVQLDGELRFQIGLLLPGRYDVVLRRAGDLVGVVASAEVEAERTLDLGALAVAPPAELDLSLVELDEFLELFLLPDGAPGRTLWRYRSGGADQVLVLPGRYEMRRAFASGSPPAAGPSFELTSGQTLTLGPDLAPR